MLIAHYSQFPGYENNMCPLTEKGTVIHIYNETLSSHTKNKKDCAICHNVNETRGHYAM